MRTVILCLAFALLLTGCTHGAENHFLPHPVNITSTSLHWGMANVSDLPTLDPALASDAPSMSVASLVYGGLVRLDSHLRVIPDAAKQWTITHQGTLYTFYLRHNLRFADGARVTAADIVSAMQRALGPEGTSGTASLYLNLISDYSVGRGRAAHSIPGILAINPTTVQIHISRPAAHFLAELAFPASFVPNPRTIQQYGAQWTDHASGFGPYSVQSWKHSKSLVLRRNPYYYAGRPELKTIKILFYDGDASAVSAYRRGKIDVLSGLAPGVSLPSGLVGARRVPGLALDYLAFNTTRLPFHHLNARRAFSAVWSPRIAEQTLGGSGFPVDGMVPAALGLHVSLPPSRGSATAYLARAHYPNGKGFPNITLVALRDPQAYDLARRLQSAWSKVLGITVSIRELNPSTYDTVLNRRDFDLAIVRWGGDYADPEDFLGTQLGPSGDNVTGWSGKDYAADVSLADSYAPTDPRRATLFRKAVLVAGSRLPLLPLDEPAFFAAINPGLSGVSLTPIGTISGDWSRARFVS